MKPNREVTISQAPAAIARTTPMPAKLSTPPTCGFAGSLNRPISSETTAAMPQIPARSAGTNPTQKMKTWNR